MVEIYELTCSWHRLIIDTCSTPGTNAIAQICQANCQLRLETRNCLQAVCWLHEGNRKEPLGWWEMFFVVHLNYPIVILCLVPCFTKIKDNSSRVVYWNMLLTGAKFKLQLAQALIIAGLKNHDSLKRRTSQPSLFNINRQVEKLWNQHPFHTLMTFWFSKSLLHFVKGQ